MKLNSLLALSAMALLASVPVLASPAASHSIDALSMVAHAPPASAVDAESGQYLDNADLAFVLLYLEPSVVALHNAFEEAPAPVDTAGLTVRLVCPVAPGNIAIDGTDNLAYRRSTSPQGRGSIAFQTHTGYALRSCEPSAG